MSSNEDISLQVYTHKSKEYVLIDTYQFSEFRHQHGPDFDDLKIS